MSFFEAFIIDDGLDVQSRHVIAFCYERVDAFWIFDVCVSLTNFPDSGVASEPGELTDGVCGGCEIGVDTFKDIQVVSGDDDIDSRVIGMRIAQVCGGLRCVKERVASLREMSQWSFCGDLIGSLLGSFGLWRSQKSGEIELSMLVTVDLRAKRALFRGGGSGCGAYLKDELCICGVTIQISGRGADEKVCIWAMFGYDGQKGVKFCISDPESRWRRGVQGGWG